MSTETTAPAIRADLEKKLMSHEGNPPTDLQMRMLKDPKIGPELVAHSVSQSELELVRSTVAKDATPEELKLFLFDCARQGVHPLDRLLHFTVRTNQGARRYTPITSIDFMRQRAADTGEYAGSDDAVYGDIIGAKYPVQATVTVWRLVQGQRCAFTATARWSEYKPDQAFMWTKMPFTMLAKCAEALALRKGFPRQLAGLYAKEEMDQARGGQAEPAIREVRTGRASTEGLPPAEPALKDRPAPSAITKQARMEGLPPSALAAMQDRDSAVRAPVNVNPYTGEEYPVLPAVEHIAYVWKASRESEWRHGTISQPDGTTREVRTKREVGDQLLASCATKAPVLIRVNDKGYVMTCEWYTPTRHGGSTDNLLERDQPF